LTIPTREGSPEPLLGDRLDHLSRAPRLRPLVLDDCGHRCLDVRQRDVCAAVDQLAEFARGLGVPVTLQSRAHKRRDSRHDVGLGGVGSDIDLGAPNIHLAARDLCPRAHVELEPVVVNDQCGRRGFPWSRDSPA
jgi:hypothetical protein